MGRLKKKKNINDNKKKRKEGDATKFLEIKQKAKQFFHLVGWKNVYVLPTWW